MDVHSEINDGSEETTLLLGKDVHPPSNESWLKPFAGLSIVILLVANAIGQAEYTQYAYAKIHFKSFYFLCWVCVSSLSVAFPLWWLGKSIIHQCSLGWNSMQHSLAQNPNYSLPYYLKCSVPLAMLNFFSSYTWYMSLDMIPVAVNTSLYRSLVIWVFLMSIIFLNEQVTISKVASLVLCLLGVVCVAVGNYEGSHSKKSSLMGYILILISSFLYATYEIVYRRFVGRANVDGVLFIQTLCGLFSAVFLWIPMMFLRMVHIEPVIDLHNSAVVVFLFISILFSVSYYLLYALGMSVTTPLYVTLSTMLNIPVAGVADYFLHGDTFSPLTVFGMVLISSGVLTINVNKAINMKVEKRRKRIWEKQHMLEDAVRDDES
jgi:drug/metabolite transporter (DMT)-like permease